MIQDHVSYNEGHLARLYEHPLRSCPYARGTDEFKWWRDGWAAADYEIWQDVLLDKRKSSTQ